MDAVNHSYGHDELGSAYFIDGVYDSGGISPPESQCNFSLRLVINEIG